MTYDLSQIFVVAEIQCVSRPVAFTAHLDLTKPLIAGTVVKNYCRVSCNNGNCFHPDSGVFTVPEGGLYLLGISIDEKVAIGVVRERPTNNDTEWICQVNGQAGYSSACNVCSVNLNPGDKLYLKVVFVDQNICSLSHYSCFTCIKLWEVSMFVLHVLSCERYQNICVRGIICLHF